MTIFEEKQHSKIPQLLPFFDVNLEMTGEMRKKNGGEFKMASAKIPQNWRNFGIPGGGDLRAAHLNPNRNISSNNLMIFQNIIYFY